MTRPPVGFNRAFGTEGLRSDHPTPLGGTCNARFDPVRELFAAKLESGEDLGASHAANIDGEMVVDLWGSWADSQSAKGPPKTSFPLRTMGPTS